MTYQSFITLLTNHELQAIIDERSTMYLRILHTQSPVVIAHVKDQYETALAEKINRKRAGETFLAEQKSAVGIFP